MGAHYGLHKILGYRYGHYFDRENKLKPLLYGIHEEKFEQLDNVTE